MQAAKHDVPDPAPTAMPQSSDEAQLLEALRSGDEAAFAALIERYHMPLLRLAAIYLPGRTAEEVVQQTWLDVLQGLGQFDGRAPLKIWIFRGLASRIRARAELEAPGVLYSSPAHLDAEPRQPAMPPERFLPLDHARWPQHWAAPPASWADLPLGRLAARAACGRIEAAIAELPLGQRAIISLRDIERWPAQDVSDVLGISEARQRALLQQARSKVRQVLEAYLFSNPA
jgi:RNA polymerase sigma-70 factor (ECF subfamily)